MLIDTFCVYFLADKFQVLSGCVPISILPVIEGDQEHACSTGGCLTTVVPTDQ